MHREEPAAMDYELKTLRKTKGIRINIIPARVTEREMISKNNDYILPSDDIGKVGIVIIFSFSEPLMF